MEVIRIYGKRVKTWESVDEKGRKVIEQIELQYTDYDANTCEVVRTGTEDYSLQRFHQEVVTRWVNTWDGQRLNQGGRRWFECTDRIQFRRSELKGVKTYLANKYSSAEMIQLRTR